MLIFSYVYVTRYIEIFLIVLDDAFYKHSTIIYEHIIKHPCYTFWLVIIFHFTRRKQNWCCEDLSSVRKIKVVNIFVAVGRRAISSEVYFINYQRMKLFHVNLITSNSLSCRDKLWTDNIVLLFLHHTRRFFAKLANILDPCCNYVSNSFGFVMCKKHPKYKSKKI